MEMLREFIRKMIGKPDRQTAARENRQREEPPQRPLDQLAAQNPVLEQRAERRPTEADIAQWRVKLKRFMAFSAEQMPRQIPPEGRQGTYACKFPLQGTENEAFLVVECLDRAARTLTVRVAPKGTDLCVMHFIKTGTRDELVAYLADEKNQDELMDSLRQLSDRADEHRR